MATTSYLDVGAVQRPLTGSTDGESHLDVGAVQREISAPPAAGNVGLVGPGLVGQSPLVSTGGLIS